MPTPVRRQAVRAAARRGMTIRRCEIQYAVRALCKRCPTVHPRSGLMAMPIAMTHVCVACSSRGCHDHSTGSAGRPECATNGRMQHAGCTGEHEHTHQRLPAAVIPTPLALPSLGAVGPLQLGRRHGNKQGLPLGCGTDETSLHQSAQAALVAMPISQARFVTSPCLITMAARADYQK